MRIQTALILFLSVMALPAVSKAARAYSISTCGVYELEGYLTRAPGTREGIQLKVNAKSDSEFHVLLGKYSAKEHEDLLDTKVRLLVGVYEKCLFECSGKWVKLKKRLDPWAAPQRFLASQSDPIEKVNCIGKN